MAVTSRMLRDVLMLCGMIFLALLIVAKLETQQAIRSNGPFTVIDGDTLADRGKRLRLRGIDAPELGQMCTRPDGAYDCGMVARAGLIRLIGNGVTECFGPEGDQDRYGRTLVTCRSSGKDLGREMVVLGLAVSNGEHHIAETEARLARRGIWGGSFQRPDDWRRQQRLEAREPGGWLRTFLFGLIGWGEAE